MPKKPNDLDRIIKSVAEAEELYAQIASGGIKLIDWMRTHPHDAMLAMKKLRFDRVGFHPLRGTELNAVEQLNQTFTILVTLKAVEQLLIRHPEAEGFRLALGTTKGRDIQSVKPEFVAAEAFSATHPNSNRKLEKDLARLKGDPATYKYVFFESPGIPLGRYYPKFEFDSKIEIHSIET